MEGMKEVYLLDQGRINFYWPKLEELFADIPGFYDYYTSEWAFDQIKKGHLLVWALDDGAIRGIVLSKINVYPKQKVFEIVGIAGIEMLKFFAEMDEVFEKLAIATGCQSFAATVRPGIARKLRNHHVGVVTHTVVRPVMTQRNQ